MAGTLILAGAVSAWVAITRAQLDATRHAEQRNRARDAALLALDRARLDGIAGLGSPTGAADKSGFRFLRTFDVAALPKLVSKEPHGRLDARPLPEEGASSSPILEVRATVRWRAERGEEVLELSTALGAADAR